MSAILRTAYQDAIRRASFYRWEASRGFLVCGNDPLTGKPLEKLSSYLDQATFREASRAAHIAMARVWLAQARDLRLRFHA